MPLPSLRSWGTCTAHRCQPSLMTALQAQHSSQAGRGCRGRKSQLNSSSCKQTRPAVQLSALRSFGACGLLHYSDKASLMRRTGPWRGCKCRLCTDVVVMAGSSSQAGCGATAGAATPPAKPSNQVISTHTHAQRETHLQAGAPQTGPRKTTRCVVVAVRLPAVARSQPVAEPARQRLGSSPWLGHTQCLSQQQQDNNRAQHRFGGVGGASVHLRVKGWSLFQTHLLPLPSCVHSYGPFPSPLTCWLGLRAAQAPRNSTDTTSNGSEKNTLRSACRPQCNMYQNKTLRC